MMTKIIRYLPVRLTFFLAIIISGVLALPTVCIASEYTHNSPAFSVAFPDNWNIVPSIYTNQILFAEDPSGLPEIHIFVDDLQAGENLKNAGKRYEEAMRRFSNDVTVLSDKEITLTNGTPACEAVYRWMWAGTMPLNSLVLMAIRNNKQITIAIHTKAEIGELEKKIAKSLKVAGEKTFVSESPSFSVTYPDNYKKLEFVSPNQVLRAQCSLGTIDASISDAPENAKLEDSGKRYADAMNTWPVASNVKLFSSEQIKLKDGSPAAMNVIEWNWKALPMKTLSLTTYKDNKEVTLSVHSWYMGFKGWGTDYETEAKEILNSMELK
jgi:hypothetical protein